MGKYDLTMKRLTSEFPEDYVRFALKTERFAVERLEVEEADKELPSLSREVDFVARVDLEGEEALLVLESETRWRGDVPERVFHYTSRLGERYKLGVYPVVLVFRPGGRLQNEWVMRAFEREIVRFRFEVIPLWEVAAKEVIAQGLKGLYPLLPLMKWEGEKAEEVLEESQKLVLEEIKNREERADAYVALRVLSGIRYPLEHIHRILRRRDLMLESPVYREILEEGEARGLEKGKAIGLEEGKVMGLELGQEEGLRESVLEALEVRFGMVPFEMEKKVRQIRGRKTLEGLHRRAILVESLEAFQKDLSRVQAS